MSKGFDGILKEFQESCWSSMSRITESYEWHEIVVNGKPAEVQSARNVYRGYVLGGYFYYMGHDRDVKYIKADRLGDKLNIITTRPKGGDTIQNRQLATAESTEVEEGFISNLPSGWMSWKNKHRASKAFSQKKLDSAVNAFKKLVASGKDRNVKKPLYIAAQMLGIDPRILSQELESRGIDPDPRNVSEGNSETKSKRPDRGKPRGMKYTNTMGLSRAINQSSDYSVVKSHSLSDGMVALVRDNNGDAYEVTIKPSYYGDYFDKERGIEEETMNEAEYPGAIGFEEVMQFHKVATPQEQAAFDELIDRGNSEEAWHLVNSTIGSQLGIEEEIHDKYATMDSDPDDYLDGDELVG